MEECGVLKNLPFPPVPLFLFSLLVFTFLVFFLQFLLCDSHFEFHIARPVIPAITPAQALHISLYQAY